MKTKLPLAVALLALFPFPVEANSRRARGASDSNVTGTIAADRARWEANNPQYSPEQREAARRRYEQAQRDNAEWERQRRDREDAAYLADLERRLDELEREKRMKRNTFPTGPYRR